MSNLPVKAAEIVCKVHVEAPLDGCAVCGTIKALLEEAHRYKEARDKLMNKLVEYLKERKAILTGIA
jgi:hypothetical protein